MKKDQYIKLKAILDSDYVKKDDLRDWVVKEKMVSSAKSADLKKDALMKMVTKKWRTLERHMVRGDNVVESGDEPTVKKREIVPRKTKERAPSPPKERAPSPPRKEKRKRQPRRDEDAERRERNQQTLEMLFPRGSQYPFDPYVGAAIMSTYPRQRETPYEPTDDEPEPEEPTPEDMERLSKRSEYLTKRAKSYEPIPDDDPRRKHWEAVQDYARRHDIAVEDAIHPVMEHIKNGASADDIGQLPLPTVLRKRYMHKYRDDLPIDTEYHAVLQNNKITEYAIPDEPAVRKERQNQAAAVAEKMSLTPDEVTLLETEDELDARRFGDDPRDGDLRPLRRRKVQVLAETYVEPTYKNKGTDPIDVDVERRDGDYIEIVPRTDGRTDRGTGPFDEAEGGRHTYSWRNTGGALWKDDVRAKREKRDDVQVGQDAVPAVGKETKTMEVQTEAPKSNWKERTLKVAEVVSEFLDTWGKQIQKQNEQSLKFHERLSSATEPKSNPRLYRPRRHVYYRDRLGEVAQRQRRLRVGRRYEYSDDYDQRMNFCVCGYSAVHFLFRD
jgi:hypothetical protein